MQRQSWILFVAKTSRKKQINPRPCWRVGAAARHLAESRGIKMKRIATLLALFCFTGLAAAGPVKGYVKKDGTYVAPHYRSAPNSTKLDNYSTKGNTNPYTGKEGTVDPDATAKQPIYQAPQVPAAPSAYEPNKTDQSK